MSSNNGTKKQVTVLIGSETLFNAVKRAMELRGYVVKTDIESCGSSEFALVGAYFLLFGVIRHLRSVNPDLPVVLINTPAYSMNGEKKDCFGVIDLDDSSGIEAFKKVDGWFDELPGRSLIKKGVVR